MAGSVDRSRGNALKEQISTLCPQESGAGSADVVAYLTPLRAGGRRERIPVASLYPADSPRQQGENREHTRVLAETGVDLPPILVHGPTMRVIDGMHRLAAAVSRGQDTVDVQFFEGTEADAFVLAVQANIAHGLPLSLADRTAAAMRILASHPAWSDRAIATVTGLSAPTVRMLRGRAGADTSVAGRRIGRDGRSRPLDSTDGRIRASEIISRHPGVSLREVAKQAGISPGTVRDVRERMRRGDPPMTSGRRAGLERRDASPARRGATESTGAVDVVAVLHGLRNDPTLRFTESGRELLRWMFSHAVLSDDLRNNIAKVPPHCAYTMADLARQFADEWQRFADEVVERARNMA